MKARAKTSGHWRAAARTAAQLLRSEAKAADLRLLFVALLLSITLVATLTAISSRLLVMLQGDAAQMLAADRAIEAPGPIPAAWQQQAQALGLKQSRFLEFQSMLYAGKQEPVLVSAKAVDQGYPLLGTLQIRTQAEGAITQRRAGPAAGQIWLERRAAQALNLTLGDTVDLGNAHLIFSALLVAEPDRGAGFMGLGPRALLNWQDIAKTGVVQTGSRISYRYLFAGKPSALAAWEAWLKPQLNAQQHWLDLQNAQPRMAQALTHAEQFLRLGSAVVLVLASLAMALAALQFAQRQMRSVAILKTLGASSAHIQRIYACQLGGLGLLATLLACALAYGLQALGVHWAAARLQLDAPSLSATPFVLAVFVALLSLLGFIAPSWWSLKKVSALTLLQERQQHWHYFSLRQLGVALACLSLLIAAYTQAPRLALILLLSLLLTVAAISLPAAWLLAHLRTPQRRLHGAWALALSHLQRRLRSNAIHAGLLSVCMMLPLLLWGLQHTLFAQWQAQIPAHAPNYFVVNLQPTQITPVQRWMAAQAVSNAPIYPMVRARLAAINGQTIAQRMSVEEADRAGINRELNLSWAAELPADNRIAAGQWWNAQNRAHGASVEEKLAQKLGIRLGDTLDFVCEGQTFHTTVTSLRSVEWERMSPNFFILLTPEQLAPYPKTYMSSFYLPPAQRGAISAFLQQFPTAIVIELEAVLAQVRRITGHASLALQGILLCALFAAGLLLMATIHSGLAERRHDNTVLRALGLQRRVLARSLLLEFALLGLFAGVLASVLAQLALLALQHWLLQLPLQLSPSLWWPAPVLGSLLIGALGYWGTRSVVRIPPMRALRSAV